MSIISPPDVVLNKNNSRSNSFYRFYNRQSSQILTRKGITITNLNYDNQLRLYHNLFSNIEFDKSLGAKKERTFLDPCILN